MEPSWSVEREGHWYRVLARASCPRCGEDMVNEEVKRAAAGPPETPPLSLRPTGDGVELVADGLLLPLVSHRCSEHP